MDNPLFLIPALAGVIFALCGFILMKYPPKKINILYGYRSASSMKSKERWDFAQPYSGRMMMAGGFFLLLIAIIGFFIPLKNEMLGVIIGIGSLITCSVLLIVLTERKIAAVFRDK